MRSFIAITLTATALSALALFLVKNNAKPVIIKAAGTTIKIDAEKAELTRLKETAAIIESYARRNNYNTKVCFLVDMRLPSGMPRFFVYDIKNDSVIKAGLVTNGSTLQPANKIIFSNQPGSNCTSLGKYKIGEAYTGDFGLAYKLYGLDSTNSNAYKRFVVLHSHVCVPDSEVAPGVICQSWGCPTVSPLFLSALKPILEKTDKPVLLKIFY